MPPQCGYFCICEHRSKPIRAVIVSGSSNAPVACTISHDNAQCCPIFVKTDSDMKRSKNPFPTAPAQKLYETFSAAIYLDNPDQMCSLLMESRLGKVYSVPLDVARMIYRHLGDTISRAERINEYKVHTGLNPAWPYQV